MRPIDADALIEFCAERWIPLNIDAVNMQPTIQPEKAQLSWESATSDLISRRVAIESIRECAEAAHDNHEWDMGQGYLNAIECIEEEPPAQPEPQWIPVSERMPRDGTWNIFTDGKNISVERYKADAIDHFFPNGRWFQLEDVIAWMPLPEPYKPNK